MSPTTSHASSSSAYDVQSEKLLAREVNSSFSSCCPWAWRHAPRTLTGSLRDQSARRGAASPLCRASSASYRVVLTQAWKSSRSVMRSACSRPLSHVLTRRTTPAPPNARTEPEPRLRALACARTASAFCLHRCQSQSWRFALLRFRRREVPLLYRPRNAGKSGWGIELPHPESPQQCARPLMADVGELADVQRPGQGRDAGHRKDPLARTTPLPVTVAEDSPLAQFFER